MQPNACTLPQELEGLFSSQNLNKAQSLVRQGFVSISFSRESQHHFIVSGLVKDGIPYKTRLTVRHEGSISSSCNCSQWSEEHHCHHIAALYLKYLVGLSQEGGWDNSQQDLSGLGVSTKKYGTIIKDPKELLGGPSRSTFASLQYHLTDKRLVPFPHPERFVGQLRLYISENRFEEQTDLNQQEYISHTLKISYLNEQGNEYKDISLFSYEYLFNWETGLSYRLPDQIKSFVKKYLKKESKASLEEIITFGRQARDQELLDLSVNDQVVTTDKEIEKSLLYNLSITPSRKKNHVVLTLNATHSETGELIELWSLFKFLCFSHGYLETYLRKIDAYEFLKELQLVLNEQKNIKQLNLRQSRHREKFETLLTMAFENEYVDDFSHQSYSFRKFSLSRIKKIWKAMLNHFSDQAFRFSSWDQGQFSLEAHESIVFQGIYPLYQEFKDEGFNIFFKGQQVGVWKGNIRFERKSSAQDWFDLHVHISENDIDILSQFEFSNNIAFTKDGLVLLEENDRELLSFLKKYKQENKFTKKDSSFTLPFKKARIFEVFELQKLGIEGLLTQEEENLCQKLKNFEKMPQYPVPEKTKNLLRPYQKTGQQWLRFLFEHKLGACLADDMGLGKTIQTISFLESVIDQVEQILIVCPVSILINWEKEIEKFSHMEFTSFYGGQRNLDFSKKIIITSYGVMKKEQRLLDKKFDIVIFDEVHHLKNIKSQGAIAARKIHADFRVCLTGTPVENDLSEFYNIIDLCIPGIWGNLQFIRTVSTKETRFVARKTARPFILRRTKPQVLNDLPEKEEHYIYLNFETNEKANYLDSLVDIKTKINNLNSRLKYGEILKGLLRLRQLCLWQNHGQSTKVDFLMENLEQITQEGHQAIVFSQFTKYLDFMQKKIEKKEISFSRIDGAQSIKKRQSEVDRFQKGDSKVFLVSLKAGGVGLNLTAASYVFLMDPWWNPAVETQAIDRAHRIGQKNKLMVYRPIIKDSVEEKVLKLQQYKRELFHDLLSTDQDSDFNGRLTMADFEALLS